MTESGLAIFLVESRSLGYTASGQLGLDLTRRVCVTAFDEAPAMLLGQGDDAAAALDRAERDFLLATAAEAAGGIGRRRTRPSRTRRSGCSSGSRSAPSRPSRTPVSTSRALPVGLGRRQVRRYRGRGRFGRGPDGGARRRPAAGGGLPRRDRIRHPRVRRGRVHLGARRAPVLPPRVVGRAPGRRPQAHRAAISDLAGLRTRAGCSIPARDLNPGGRRLSPERAGTALILVDDAVCPAAFTESASAAGDGGRNAAKGLVTIRVRAANR